MSLGTTHMLCNTIKTLCHTPQHPQRYMHGQMGSKGCHFSDGGCLYPTHIAPPPDITTFSIWARYRN